MVEEQLDQLKYPIGHFKFPGGYDEATRSKLKKSIGELPAKLRAATENLSEEQLNLHYRPGGWTIRQVVHHVADSHLNSIIRFKLALTEDTPSIKPYDEAAWAELRDTAVTPIEVSLKLLEALHTRWINLLDGFSEKEWQKKAYHPERKAEMALEEFLGLYAWHGEHHLAHVNQALK
ncbi:YfiT family bacillithiol transferase [Flavilitoribacter nigricans]|uniref:Metal-dependent hydrolase n=1 Tax=Flavilitoribacter nigricans (strain ATCC 23147 / DSM 23189 / NBRC 102662 / NCIMB 1420 / SS-2) TaxID=1122177 RepID=A0A2D0NDF0_FLAN2|nr:putative metal-dependent hydrolase [Flavilitoribacter nigricans]PHN06396.1 metal-dependent hydrolase [Flavilitoribacter nigricans DSM 23189 = NBRC 102662]